MSEPQNGPSGATFISYASADREMAEAMSAYLERHGIRCWMAPRDVPAGALYADAIVRAINDSSSLLLLLSRASIGSSHVGKELERASSKRKRIIAARLDEAPLTPAFEYFLSESQWVDVPAERREVALARLAQALGSGAAPPAAAPPAPAATPAAPPTRRPWRRGVAFGGLALAVVLVGGLLAYSLHRRVPPAATAVTDKSIAVLPFTDMSERHDQEYFADGMAEQILDLLAKIPSLKVIARTSSFQFKGKSEDVRVIGEKLGVATLLEGSVRKAGDRLRITAQLVRASDGSHLWSEVYDREIRDVFRTQDEIADAVVAALRVSLLGSSAAQRPPPTANTAAYALYLQGLAYWQRYTAVDSLKAREYFEQATALDPNFALAWAALSVVYTDAFVFGSRDSFETIRERIETTARRALAIDPRLAEAHVALANLGFVNYDIATSAQELRTALELEPDNLAALDDSIYVAITVGHLDEAERLARRLIERDPLSADQYRGLATALWFKGQTAEAEATYRRLLAFRPGAESMHYRLAQLLIVTGRPQEALTELAAEPSAQWQAVGRVMAYDALGRRPEADQQLALLMKDQTGWQYQMAQIYAHRRDPERTFHWLEQARQAHDPGYLNYLKCDPMLSGLRDDSRYQSLLAGLNLPP